MGSNMNKSSSFYGNLDAVTNKMAGLLLNSKEFAKYLQYSGYNPLDGADIASPLELVGKRFFLQPKPDKIIVESGAYVEMFLSNDKPQKRSGGLFTDYIVTFNVICHLDSWSIQGGIRPYRIMNIIDSTFSGANMKDISFGEIVPLGSQFIKFTDKFDGYKLGYVLSWNGNADC